MSTLAEQIAEKYGLPTKDTPMVENADWTVTPKWPDTVEQKSVIPALSEMRRLTWAQAMEAAARQADGVVYSGPQSAFTDGQNAVAKLIGELLRSLKTEPASEVENG